MLLRDSEGAAHEAARRGTATLLNDMAESDMAESDMAESDMAESDGATMPAQEGSPLSPGWRVGRAVVGGGLAISFAVHMVLVGAVLFVSPRIGHPEPVASVTVDLVTPDEIATPPDKPQTDPPKPSPPAPETDKAPQPSASQPAAPRLDAFAPPFAPSAVPPSGPPPAPSQGPAAELAQMLGLPAPVAGLGGGPPSEYQANLTADEVAGFAAHVQSCWSAPAGVANASALTVFVRVSLKRDGSLASAPEPLSYPASNQGSSLMDSALRALQQCSAYAGLPPEKYDEWRLLDLRFSPSGISTASPVPSAQRKPARQG
jgi:hypothetical protein